MTRGGACVRRLGRGPVALGLAGLVATGLAMAAGPARAEVRALVIGIDAYAAIPPLDGAVNDALAIRAALRDRGVRDLTLLLDQAATRPAVLDAWASMVDRSAPGDLLVMSYAGHGSQEPEHQPGSEADGLDETLLLAGFTPGPPGNADRILDDELAVMLARAAGRRVVVIADSCHSGTVTRAFDPRAGQRKTRFVPTGGIRNDALVPLTLSSAGVAQSGTGAAPGGAAEGGAAEGGAEADDDRSLPHVLFLAGVDDASSVAEVTLNGQPHGALSYAVAQALEGGGDADGDGRITVGEFDAFVREAVRILTDGRQAMQGERGADLGSDSVLVSLIPAAAGSDGSTPTPTPAAEAAWTIETAADPAPAPAPASAPASASASIPQAAPPAPQEGGALVALDLALATGAGLSPAAAGALLDSAASGIRRGLSQTRIVTDPAAADLIWDPATGQVISPLGDIVARLDGATPEAQAVQVLGVAGKWAAIETLKSWPETTRLSLVVSPGDGIHLLGQSVSLSLRGQTLPHLTVMALDPLGGVHLVFPLVGYGDRSDAYAGGRPFDLPMTVTAPTGADHFVALATTHPLPDLWQAVAAMEGQAAGSALVERLATLRARQRIEAGIHGVFTAP